MSGSVTMSSPLPVPEPDLTAHAIIGRARAMRPWLREQQSETEQRTSHSAETDRRLTEAGFFRILQPRRFGGYEFDTPTFLRVVIEIARGCPSTGWAFCLSASHVLQVASLYSEEAQAEFFRSDGHFACASFAYPLGIAESRDGGYVLDGTWPFVSGITYSTHFLGQTLLHPSDPSDPGLMFVVPRESFTVLDDWGDILGLVGTGSNSVRITKAWIPERFTVRQNMLDLQVDGGTVGSRLHGNSMYGGRAVGFFQGELAAIMIGAAYAALDEYEHLIRTKPFTWQPRLRRMDIVDYQRNLGYAMAKIECAEAAVVQSAERWMELCRRNADENIPYSAEEDARLDAVCSTAARLALDAVESNLYRTSGTVGSRRGERLQRYWRDISTYFTHNTIAQQDMLRTRLGRLHLGLPLDLPGMLPLQEPQR